MSASSSLTVKVVTYNILSPACAGPERFPRCSLDELSAERRRDRVIEGPLTCAVKSGAVVALQEVPWVWVRSLHVFFAGVGYFFAHSQERGESSGFMGVGLAWPLETFMCAALEMCRLSETKTTPWPVPVFEPRGLKRTESSGGCRDGGRSSGVVPTRARADAEFRPWVEAERFEHCIVLARLRHVWGGWEFCVATYHMPCLFGAREHMWVMNIHASLAAQKLLAFSTHRPCVLMGDFNFKPWDSPYLLLTHGRLDADHPEHPAPAGCDTWRVSPLLKCFSSAYKEMLGKEPRFTTYKAKSRGSFMATLDYIFTWGFRVVDVDVPPHEREFPRGLPCGPQGSDHVPIGAVLEVCE